MKKSIALALFLTGCASAPPPTIDQRISSYEQKCLPLNEKIINEKLARPENKTTREEWENVVYKDYRAAKDISNSESQRNESISKAVLNCMVLERLR